MGNTDGCFSTTCVDYSLFSSCFVGSGTSPLALLVGIAVGILLFLIIVVGIGIYLCKRHKKYKKFEDEKEEVEFSQLQ